MKKRHSDNYKTITPGDFAKIDKPTIVEEKKFGKGPLAVLRTKDVETVIVMTKNSPEPKEGVNGFRAGPIKKDRLKKD